MKKLFIYIGSLLLLFIPCEGMGQLPDTCHTQCAYKYTYPSRNGWETETIMLQIGNRVSKSFSYSTYRCDSLLGTPGGFDAMSASLTAFFAAGDLTKNPSYTRYIGWYIYKNHPKAKMTVQDNISLDYFYYTEDHIPIDWTLLSDTCSILGYACIKATTVYHGRGWQVWFAPEIPISDGPWKLSGLPGLILRAESNDGLYRFDLEEIIRCNKPMALNSAYRATYRKTTRRKFLRLRHAYEVDAGFYTIASLGDDLGFLQSSPRKLEYDQLECDYH